MLQSFVAVQGLYPFHCCEGRANSNSKPLQACTGKFTSNYSLVAVLGLSLRLATGNQALQTVMDAIGAQKPTVLLQPRTVVACDNGTGFTFHPVEALLFILRKGFLSCFKAPPKGFLLLFA